MFIKFYFFLCNGLWHLILGKLIVSCYGVGGWLVYYWETFQTHVRTLLHYFQYSASPILIISLVYLSYSSSNLVVKMFRTVSHNTVALYYLRRVFAHPRSPLTGGPRRSFTRTPHVTSLWGNHVLTIFTWVDGSSLLHLWKCNKVTVERCDKCSVSFNGSCAAITALVFQWYFNNSSDAPVHPPIGPRPATWISNVSPRHDSPGKRVSFLPTVNIQILYSYSEPVFLCMFCSVSVFIFCFVRAVRATRMCLLLDLISVDVYRSCHLLKVPINVQSAGRPQPEMRYKLTL